METPNTSLISGGTQPRYQIAILGPTATIHIGALQATLAIRASELSPDLPSLIGFMDAAETLVRHPKSPVVGVYFGGSTPKADDLAAINSLLASSSTIIPVVNRLDGYQAQVPVELHRINGTQTESSDPGLEAIANLVLENLGLIRKTRRLFVSYRRDEASPEALQLRHALDECGYDVFLDTHSVAKGDDFQQVLWQRLADSDIVVVLDTPGFMERRWTKEELAQAAAMTIGLVQVVWPSAKPVRYSDLCERIYVEDADFKEPNGFTSQTLSNIIRTIEQLRARSLAARHDNLVREFCDAAASVHIRATVQPERYITADVKAGTLVAIPAVGVPDAALFHTANARFPTDNGECQLVAMIYDQRGLSPAWLTFLDWLDTHLPVKTIRITAVAYKLSSL